MHSDKRGLQGLQHSWLVCRSSFEASLQVHYKSTAHVFLGLCTRTFFFVAYSELKPWIKSLVNPLLQHRWLCADVGAQPSNSYATTQVAGDQLWCCRVTALSRPAKFRTGQSGQASDSNRARTTGILERLNRACSFSAIRKCQVRSPRLAKRVRPHKQTLFA